MHLFAWGQWEVTLSLTISPSRQFCAETELRNMPVKIRGANGQALKSVSLYSRHTSSVAPRYVVVLELMSLGAKSPKSQGPGQ